MSLNAAADPPAGSRFRTTARTDPRPMTGMTRARDGPAADRGLRQQGITSNMALKLKG